MREAVAALWAAWSLYQVVQACKPGQRIGFILGAGLSGLTSYLLVTQ